jgi:uncharacterized phage infection (PIP) family protein YhgE
LTAHDSEIDNIYSAPVEDFIKLRNDLAGRLKKDGDLEAAAEVASLKKPSISAWIVNQLARSAQLELQRLVKAGEEIEQAQRRSISGEISGGFADARKEEAAAIGRLRTAAKKVSPKASPAILDRVANTLRAGSATSEGRDLLKRGRLTGDLEAPGFDAFSGAVPVTTSTARRAEPKKESAKLEKLRRRMDEAQETAETLAGKADDLEAGAEAAEEAARKVAEAAVAARKKADSAKTEVGRIQSELAQLEKGS